MGRHFQRGVDRLLEDRAHVADQLAVDEQLAHRRELEPWRAEIEHLRQQVGPQPLEMLSHDIGDQLG